MSWRGTGVALRGKKINLMVVMKLCERQRYREGKTGSIPPESIHPVLVMKIETPLLTILERKGAETLPTGTGSRTLNKFRPS